MGIASSGAFEVVNGSVGKGGSVACTVEGVVVFVATGSLLTVIASSSYSLVVAAGEDEGNGEEVVAEVVNAVAFVTKAYK